MKSLFISFFLCLAFLKLAHGRIDWETKNPAMDLEMFENVIDEEKCAAQLNYIAVNDSMLGLRFLDNGIRIPRKLFEGNTLDMGSYYECLNMKSEINEDMLIEGKYCSIRIPIDLTRSFGFPTKLEQFSQSDIPQSKADKKTMKDLYEKIYKYEKASLAVQELTGGGIGSTDDRRIVSLNYNVAVCIPKVCSTNQALASLYLNYTNLEYQESYCRLPNDKPWVPVDYLALVIFLIIGLLVMFSTYYDIDYTIMKKKDPKKINKIYQCFSVYTNTRRLITYTPVKGTIECLDGIRSLAMLWVIIGHTYSTQSYLRVLNPIYYFSWSQELKAVWIMSATITVDTFFVISGLLIVYVTAGKFSGEKLMKNLHLFYLNRVLRMLPVLATCILFQASLLHKIGDGPHWDVVIRNTQNCRKYWWSTLLYVQNYVNPSNLCLGHTWYLAIDMQLYIVSPLILFWVLGKRMTAWIALSSSLIITMIASTIYCFMYNLPAGVVVPSRLDEYADYMKYYYMNTLTRASPFLIGMILGYIMHLYKDRELVISKITNTVLWFFAFILSLGVVFVHNFIMQDDWDNQTVDNFINSFMRAIWALCLSWLILACHHGYAGPINWILTLQCWKVFSRLSYAIYIFHFPVMQTIVATAVEQTYFLSPYSITLFFGYLGWALISAFLVTVLIDAPISTIIKQSLGGGAAKRPKKLTDMPMNNEFYKNSDYKITQ